MASCYRTNDLLGAHAVCQQQFQQQQQQHHHVVQQQQQQQQPPQKDYSIPLFVDCSVEYELPKQAKPPVGVRVEPLLMIHPCHFRKMEIQTRSPFVNNMPNFKQRSSIKSSQESSKNVIVSTVAPAGYHQPSAKALDIQIQHHQKLQQQQQLKAVGHMTVGQQQQCSMAAGYQQHYQPDLPQRVHKVQKSSKDYALQSAYCDYNTRLTSHNQMLQLQTQVDQQQQQQSNVASYAPQSWNGYEMSTSRKPTQQMLAASDNYIIKKSNSNNTQCYSTTQVNSAAAQLKAAQGQVMYQQQPQQQQTNGVGKKDAMLSNGCDMYKNNNNLITNATTTTTTTTNKNINNNNNNLINHNNTSSNNNNSTTQCNRNYNNNNMPNKQYTDTSGGLWRHPTSSSSSTPSCSSSASIASMAAITQQHQQQQQQHLQQQNFQIPGDINMSSQALIKNYQQINRNNVINSAKYRQYLKSHRIHPYMMTGSCVNTTGFPQMASAFPHHQMQQVPCYNV